MKKIGKPYLDQGKMWQDVEFEYGDLLPEGNQFSINNKWIDNGSSNCRTWSQTRSSAFKRRIPVVNKVQENAKKNLLLLREMLLSSAKIVRRDGDCVRVVSYPSDLLKDGEFFKVNYETHKYLKDDRIGPDKYAIFEALAEGKNVQFKIFDGWEDFDYFNKNCHFEAANHLYRIKPEEIPDTTIKWTSVTEKPIHARMVYILYKSGSIDTVEFFDGQFNLNGREIQQEHIKGWAYA